MITAAKTLALEADVIAPDGCAVRILARTPRGSMAHFTLGPGQVSRAVAHRTVEEVWFFLAGKGRMWRRLGEREETVDVAPGVSLSIPLGTHFLWHILIALMLGVILIAVAKYGASRAVAESDRR